MIDLHEGILLEFVARISKWRQWDESEVSGLGFTIFHPDYAKHYREENRAQIHLKDKIRRATPRYQLLKKLRTSKKILVKIRTPEQERSAQLKRLRNQRWWAKKNATT